jgi:hypothetical protein
MAHFQTETPDLGKFWTVLQDVGIFVLFSCISKGIMYSEQSVCVFVCRLLCFFFPPDKPWADITAHLIIYILRNFAVGGGEEK